MFLKLVDDLRARFIERGFTEVSIDEGREARNAQANYGAGSANRIVFTPAPDPMQVLAPTHIGEDDTGKRQLLNVMFVYEVAFAGYDADNPERDLAHRRKCFDLFEVTVQEVQRAYWGAHEWSSPRWNDAKKHLSHGAELLATLALNIPIFDVGNTIATPDPVAEEPKELFESLP